MDTGPIRKIKADVINNPEWWFVPFMDFVDDFRRDKDTSFLQKPFTLDNERIDALLASTVEYLCDEMGLNIPEWIEDVPSCREPWFVSGTKHPKLREIILEESPKRFRERNIWVLENFLYRV